MIGRVPDVVARPRPPRGALSPTPAPDGDGHRESVCDGRWEGGGDGRAVGWQVEAGVQSSTGSPKLFDRYKIGYADSNGGIDERGFSCRAWEKPGWAL